MPAPGTAIPRLVAEIDAELRSAGTPDRAQHEKAYLKSELEHYGTTVSAVRSVAKTAVHRHELDHDELIAVAVALWAEPVHERRMAAVELLDLDSSLLQPGDIRLLERLLRESRTWALVDGLAASVVVYEWLLPRAGRASGVTLREAVKPLSDRQRAEILAAR